MFRHIVCFKFRDEIRDEAIATATANVYGLKDKIDVIRSIEIGQDVLRRNNSFDLALVMTFDDIDAYKEYDSHPAHAPVKSYNLAASKQIASVDYSF